ncbi:MAG: GGDEF domain-containing protein [Woeseiaceae bacterium]|nr:GGDEF domain-containing protein [Woeseiaceae bacterium]
MAIPKALAQTWSATDFGDVELSSYAETELLDDTRKGVQVMAVVSLCMQFVITMLILVHDLGMTYLSSTGIFAALSAHVFVAARYVDDVRGLQVLGMTFLIIGALAVTFLAHEVGDLNVGMMAAVVMLFVAIPIVPWALREASLVVVATYGLMTSSFLSVPGRFESGALLVLQLLLFGAATIVIFVTARNTLIRKHDIRARFDLENAHDAMELLSMQDALTNAWNRRFLEEQFPKIADQCLADRIPVHVAVIDIDDFKGINDQFGHHIGDEILTALADILMQRLGDDGYLVRLGGDEFQIIYCADDLEALIDGAIHDLQQSAVAAALAGRRKITLTAGIVSSEPDKPAVQEALYRTADTALYAAKTKRPADNDDSASLARTGTWQL